MYLFKNLLPRWLVWSKEEEKEQQEEKKVPGLTDFVFSWSLTDIMNKDLYRDKVDLIPDTFSSLNDYLKSFVNPLLEETHADLHSSISNLHSAPASEIFRVKTSKYPLHYEMILQRPEKNCNKYEPQPGDLIALTEVRPKCIDDLNRPKRPYLVALVQGMKDDDPLVFHVISSKPIDFKNSDEDNGEGLFAVCLTNLTTNTRIWSALHPDEGANMRIINSVLHINPSAQENCTLCSSRGSINLLQSREVIKSFGLDNSQRAAVLNCIALTDCDHENSVKLIWGPPGTGKTKTVASLVFALLKLKCRTLTCAPTNVAVIGVAKRLMSCRLSGTLQHETYGLGDIVLFGNKERMKIDDHEDLHHVFLDYRVKVLARCFAPLTGWKSSLDRMIGLLEDPQDQYRRYVVEQANTDEDEDGIVEAEEEKNVLSGQEDNICKETSTRNLLKKIMIQNMMENKKNKLKEKLPLEERSKSKGGHDDQLEANKKATKSQWTFEEFFMKRFFLLRENLVLYITAFYTHLPTSCVPFQVLENMTRVLGMLQLLETFLGDVDTTSEGCLLLALFGGNETVKGNRITSIRAECLNLLKVLRITFTVQKLIEDRGITNLDQVIRNFCLNNAYLIFCTVSSSAKLHRGGMAQLKMVIIDEAAQLKECESAIPLQLPGLRHAILVGDEKQLPAMVMSKICEKAGFGRSLFERLVMLGHRKHLLNVQYRMHPSISLFPNKEFYGNQISDGPNVRGSAYQRRFLEEKMFGSFSFINVTNGKEEFDNRHSRKNIAEVSLVGEILSKLYKVSIKSKTKVRIGCISPYKGQVFAIQESLGKTYSTDPNDLFSVNVRSVDGFQGGEEDIIIISTVRCNGSGAVGFLDNRQRANVALTRARHCLWILGNGATLLNSGSVWRKLVMDAKNRNCFYNAYEDEKLSLTISNAPIQLHQLKSLFSMESVLFKAANWKVCFTAEFHESITRLGDLEIAREVASLLSKLTNGWRKPKKDEIAALGIEGASTQLLECYDVRGQIKLVWTIDILRVRENSFETQVIKVMDILPASEIKQLAKKFEAVIGNYTVNQISRCLCKRNQRGLILPMTWPVGGRSNDLATQLAAISLRDDNVQPTSHITRSTNLELRSYRRR